MEKNYRTIFSLLSLISLVGCQVGPDYSQPCTAMPTSYIEARRVSGQEVSLSCWWEQFNDPVLNTLVETATCANFDLGIALERIEELRAYYRFESANLWPQVDAIGTARRERQSQTLFETPFEGPAIQNFFSAGFEASWELDLFGRLRRSKEAAFAELQASVDAARDARVVVVADVATHYVSLRRFQKLIELKTTRIELLNRELALVSNQFSAGLIDGVTVERLKEGIKREETALVSLETAKKASVYALGLLLAKQPAEMESLLFSQGAIPDARGRLFGEVPSDLLRRRPDIRLAEQKLAARVAEIGVAMADLFPTFSLLGTFRYESSDQSLWFKSPSRAWSIGPTFRWPILDFGRIRANIDATRSRERQALLNFEKGVLAALEEVETRFVSYFNGELEVGLKEEELAAAERESALFWDRSLSGLESEIEAIQSVVRSLGLKEELIEKRAVLADDLIAVYKALGGGW